MTTALLLGVAVFLVVAWFPRRRAARFTPLRREHRSHARPPSLRPRRREPPTGPPTPAQPGRALRRRIEAVIVHRRRRPPDVGAVISEVASRLHAGAPTEAAWSAAVDRALGPGRGAGRGDEAERALRVGSGFSQKPDPTRNLAGAWAAPAAHPAHHFPPVDELRFEVPVVPLPSGLRRLSDHCRGEAVAEQAMQAVTAATLLSHTLGAPLAEVLDRCAEAVVEAERAHDARRVALAGPRSTARILTGLPVLGIMLGAGLGADPLAAATDGGWGTLAVGCGLLLLVTGARWSASLVSTAERPVSERGLLRRRTFAGGPERAAPRRSPP